MRSVVKKRGAMLVENIIFLVLNLAFLAILVIFLVNQGSGASVLEDSYSKQVALLIDSAMPGMSMKINMNSAMQVADKNGFPFDQSLVIKDQYVTVKLGNNSEKSYQFFNDINVSTVRAEKGSNGKFDGYYYLEFRRKI